MKKGLSILLCLVIMLGVVASISFDASAQEINLAKTGGTLYWPVYGHTSLSRDFWAHGGQAIDISDGSINGADVRAAIGGTVTSIWLCSNNHLNPGVTGIYGVPYVTPDRYDSGGNPNPTCCSGNGHGLVIHGDDGRYYNYAHLQSGSIPTDKVYYGARVNSGQYLGRVGCTGNATGPHLHFVISTSSRWWDTGIVNPQNEVYNYNPTDEGYLPLGWLDSVKVVNNEVTVKGWAYDKDCPNRPIDVHIYVGDECHITTANLDLDPGVTSYTGYSNHCFQTTFTTNKSGSQEVKAYGINVDKNGTPVGTGNAQLNQSFTVNITQITGSNLGDDFYANIITGKNGLAVGADSDDNVRVQTRDGRDNQIWHFQRNSDGTYCITNVGQNKYLDNTGGAWGHPDGIKLFSSSDIDAQRWYVQLTNSGYSFIPKSSKTSAATVSLASFSEGTYIIGRQYKESIAQIFTIDYVGLKPAVTSTYNGHTYELYDITCSWHQAYRTCEQLGGHLVTIASKGENDFVWSLKYSGTKKSDYLWLGATDEINEGTWQWITGESFTYHPWASTQPDNAGSAEHYLEMNADSSWNDLTKYYNPHHPVFICEYDNTSINASAYTPSKTTTYNNKTYEYYNTEVMWSTAKAICEAKGGHLVIINDTSENKAVNDLAKNRVWLGFSDIGTEGRFIDVLGNELTYSNWLSGEPNNYYMCENYAEMYADGTWNDARYAKRGFVCEYELPNYLGDVDGDGSITITDATTIQRYIAEYELPNPDIIQKCGDVDGDGSITVTDATTIQKYIAEYELPYPIGEPVA